jgi:hypothetical protein
MVDDFFFQIRARQHRIEYLARMRRNAEVLAEFLMSATNKGQQRIFRAWYKVGKDRKAKEVKSSIIIQCAFRCYRAKMLIIRLRRRKDNLQFAFITGKQNRDQFILKRSFDQLKRFRRHQKLSRKALLVQKVVRGRQGRKKARLERVILKMRGRSGMFLVRKCFEAWSLPKKNRKRRLASIFIQRIWRGFLGRRLARYAWAEWNKNETAVLETIKVRVCI